MIPIGGASSFSAVPPVEEGGGGAKKIHANFSTPPPLIGSAPRHRPRPMGGCHPTRCLPLPEPPLRLIRQLGQWGSNLGPAMLEPRVLPLKHAALHPTYGPTNTQLCSLVS